MPPKVLMVSGPVHVNPPLKGAAVETWMHEVSRRLIRFEPHIVSISHPFYPLREYRDGIYYHRIHMGRLYKRLFQKITKIDPYSYPRRIAGIVNEVRPDIVHMHNSVKWFANLGNYFHDKGTKTILHMHNEARPGYAMQVDSFVGCSNYIVNSYKGTSVRADAFTCIYNGVDVEKFRPYWEANALREDVRRRFGLAAQEFVVLFVGRISAEKGVEHFIRAALLLNDVENVRFLVVGEIAEGGGRRAYADDMRQLARPLGDKLVFTGVFPPSKVHLIYLLGDAVVLPSNFEEPFSMVAIEAMATGLPVVAAPKGGMREYLVDGVNGLFIQGDDYAPSIQEQVRRLRADAGLRRKLGEAGRSTVVERFSWEKIASDTERHYLKLLQA